MRSASALAFSRMNAWSCAERLERGRLISSRRKFVGADCEGESAKGAYRQSGVRRGEL